MQSNSIFIPHFGTVSFAFNRDPNLVVSRNMIITEDYSWDNTDPDDNFWSFKVDISSCNAGDVLNIILPPGCNGTDNLSYEYYNYGPYLEFHYPNYPNSNNTHPILIFGIFDQIDILDELGCHYDEHDIELVLTQTFLNKCREELDNSFIMSFMEQPMENYF